MAPLCPPGLECLSRVDQIIIKQKLEFVEIVLDFETKNRYVILNTQGQRLFYAAEDSGCLARNCCSRIRAFNMQIMDNSGHKVMNLHRPWACRDCCCPCCLQSMEVSAPPDFVVGMIKQNWTFCTPSFTVTDSTGDELFYIKGPLCACSWCFCDTDFNIYSASTGVEIGKITKKWLGLAKEIFTDADNFGITFSADLDVKKKATLLGACFLIDMIYFEDNHDL